MIDGVNIRCSCQETIARMKENKKLSFWSLVNIDTGEIPKSFTDYFYSLRVSISKSNILSISGSLHKFWNEYHQRIDKQGKGYNFDDFSLNDVGNALTLLCNELELDPSRLSVNGFEFGVNVDVLFNPFQFCENILSYKKKPLTAMESNNATLIQIGVRCKQNQFVVKAYDKSKQYYLKDRNIFRFEIKVKRMQFLEGKGVAIHTVEDLVDAQKMVRLGELLIVLFNDLLIDDDTVNLDKLTRKEERAFQKCRIAKDWKAFSDIERHRHKMIFNRVIEEHGKRGWKKEVGFLLKDKWNMLLSIPLSVSVSDSH